MTGTLTLTVFPREREEDENLHLGPLLEGEGTSAILNDLIWSANWRFVMVRGLVGGQRSGTCCALCD